MSKLPDIETSNQVVERFLAKDRSAKTLSEKLPELALDDFSNGARVWLFFVSPSLNLSAEQDLKNKASDYLAQWKAHGVPIRAGVSILYSSFLVVVADQEQCHVSGCSIDALFREIVALGKELGLDVIDHTRIFFREGRTIRVMPKDEFKQYALNGHVNALTIVFNNAVTTLGELRSGKWELPFGESWHATRFKLKEG